MHILMLDTMRRRHPTEGALRAFLDREVAPRTWWAVRWHLWRCGACRARLHDLRLYDTAIAGLLRPLADEIDPTDAWVRFVTLSGVKRPALWPTAMRVAVGLGLVVLGWSAVHGSDQLDQQGILALIERAQAHPDVDLLRDTCCDDHDGGTLKDDGLLTLSLPGERVSVVVVYEDLDGSGSFTPGDKIRFVSKAKQ